MNEAQDIATALDGARLANVLPLLQAELQKMEEASVVRMDQMLQKGTLTPELAQMAWIELIGYRRLRRRLEQKVRIGVSAGTRQEAILNGGVRSFPDEPPLPI